MVSNTPGNMDILDIYSWIYIFFLLEILQFYWNFARSPGNFMVLWRLL